jgi:hypothetical protein
MRRINNHGNHLNQINHSSDNFYSWLACLLLVSEDAKHRVSTRGLPACCLLLAACCHLPFRPSWLARLLPSFLTTKKTFLFIIVDSIKICTFVSMLNNNKTIAI